MPVKISAASKHHPLHSRRRTLRVPMGAQRFLAALEGFEGGFAIGASIVVALALTGLEQHLLIVTAVVTLIVSGFNNACVKYSSEHYLDELDGREKESAFKHYFIPALIEFVCYFAISFISIVPLLVIKDIHLAIWATIALTLLILFVAGYWRGYMLHVPKWRDALETTLLGAGIIIVGVISGFAIKLL